MPRKKKTQDPLESQFFSPFQKFPCMTKFLLLTRPAHKKIAYNNLLAMILIFNVIAFLQN